MTVAIQRKNILFSNAFSLIANIKVDITIFCEGEWYCVEKNYIDNLKKKLDTFFGDYKILADCKKRKEKDYNDKIAASDNFAVCLDGKNFAPSGNMEPCDLCIIDNGHLVLIHNKISTKSYLLSHFVQSRLEFR